jgi:hypothetical protein
MKPKRTRFEIGQEGELAVYQLLCSVYGRKVQRMPYNHPFDLLVDGLRVDVKTANPHRTSKHHKDFISWCFNIHKAGIVLSSQADCYVCRLEGVPFSRTAIHLAFVSPITVPTIIISMRSLLDQRYAKEREQFRALTEGTLRLSYQK